VFKDEQVLTSTVGLQFLHNAHDINQTFLFLCHHTCWTLDHKGISFPPLSSISLCNIFVIATGATEKLLQKYDNGSQTGNMNMDIQKFVISTCQGWKIIQSVTHYSTSSRHYFCIHILVNRYSSVVFCSVSKHGTEEFKAIIIKIKIMKFWLLGKSFSSHIALRMTPIPLRSLSYLWIT